MPYCKSIVYFTHVAEYRRHYSKCHKLNFELYKGKQGGVTSTELKRIKTHLLRRYGPQYVEAYDIKVIQNPIYVDPECFNFILDPQASLKRKTSIREGYVRHRS